MSEMLGRLLTWAVVSWQAVRDDRRQRMLEKSWAIYRASRQIHDQTTAALQEKLDTARARNSERL